MRGRLLSRKPMSLERELLVDLVGLIIALWIFAFVGCFVFIWYQSYAMIESFELEQPRPSHWLAKAASYIAFHLSPKLVSNYIFPLTFRWRPKRIGNDSIWECFPFFLLEAWECFCSGSITSFTVRPSGNDHTSHPPRESGDLGGTTACPLFAGLTTSFRHCEER
jgi:hypothetical protein